MIKLTNIGVYNIPQAIKGMRNPKDSWNLSDSYWGSKDPSEDIMRLSENYNDIGNFNPYDFYIGEKDLELAKTLVRAGTDHSKFMRQIMINIDILAPIYWWKEMDKYAIGTTTNSTSTMVSIHKKEFVLDDFSHDLLPPKNKKFQLSSETPIEPLKEEFKWIKGYENMYKLSNIGAIVRVPYAMTTVNGFIKEYKGGILNHSINSSGYKKVILIKDGVRTNFYVHRLLAEHFIDNTENKPEVNHKDGNRLNNNLSNLEWVTSSENSLHAVKIGQKIVSSYNRFQVTNNLRKFNADEVNHIRNLYAGGKTKKEISEIMGCYDSIICDLLNGKSYKDISLDKYDIWRVNLDNLNKLRQEFLDTGNKEVWRQLIQMLPSSFNQLRTWTGNYQVLRNMYHARKNHKLSEWREFCGELEKLPYHELITVF